MIKILGTYNVRKTAFCAEFYYVSAVIFATDQVNYLCAFCLLDWLSASSCTALRRNKCCVASTLAIRADYYYASV